MRDLTITLPESVVDVIEAAIHRARGTEPTPPHKSTDPFVEVPAKYQHLSADLYRTRYDDPMPDGTPGTVTIPVTKHVLSLPQPQYGPDGKLVVGKGETFVPYLNRVRFQITARPDGSIDAAAAQQVTNSLGFAMQSSSSLMTLVGDNPDTWPFGADEFANREQYHPEERGNAIAAIKIWSDEMQKARDDAIARGAVPPIIPDTGPAVADVSGNAPA